MKKALVITGEGLNCESETAHALIRAGADAEIKHLRDLIAEPKSLQNYRILAICGGFSLWRSPRSRYRISTTTQIKPIE